MASSNCLRSLARPSTTLFPWIATAHFSTTAVLAAAVPKNPNDKKSKNTRSGTVKGQMKTLRISKKAFVKPTGKPPAPGERKAIRKRVVLSNTNALVVEGLRELDEVLVGELGREVLNGGGEGDGHLEGQVNEVVGSVVGLKGETVDSLRAVDAFKTTQGWGLFRRPALLVREESVVLSRRLVQSEGKDAVRIVVDGKRGTGKSLLLVHAMATAFVREWVVLNIPEAQEVTNAMNDYAPLPNTTPTLWSQPSYTANLLSQIHKANNAVLQNLQLTQQHNLPIPIQPDITLARLCELGARDPEIAYSVFLAFWAEITSAGRPPVLMCLDSLSHVMQDSLYRAQDYSPIHAHDLALVRHFMTYFSGEKKLPNGGGVLAATSRSHAPTSKSLELAVAQNWERAEYGEVETQRDPYEKSYDARADRVLESVEVMKVGGLTKGEARGLMEYWAKSGVLRQVVDERTVAEKWALAGGGVVGEIQRGALRMRI